VIAAAIVLAILATYVVGYLRGIDRGVREEKAMEAYRRSGDPGMRP